MKTVNICLQYDISVNLTDFGLSPDLFFYLFHSFALYIC